MTGRRRRPCRRSLGGLALACALLTAACADDGTGGSTSGPRDATSVRALDLLRSSRSPYASGDDVWEVWICRVPNTVGHPLYADDPWRIDRTADDLVAILQPGVGEWYRSISHGQYRPVFRSGGRVSIDAAGDGFACVDRAVARAGADVDGVLVVADARHRDGLSGGWGRPGTCSSPCRAAHVGETGRAVYVGAADFGPAWGDRPPLDLVQHEIGHALDLPHSGALPDEIEAATGGAAIDGPYTSPIDMMSDSTAPRQVRPDRRDAPDTIAANRIALGWLSDDSVDVVPPSGLTTDIAASTASSGRRALVVPIDDGRLVTIELLVPTGANDHLPASGIAVHIVDQRTTACDGPTGRPCTGQYRRQTPLVDDVRHPGIPLLGPGATVDVGPVVVRVISLDGATGRVAIEPG